MLSSIAVSIEAGLGLVKLVVRPSTVRSREIEGEVGFHR